MGRGRDIGFGGSVNGAVVDLWSGENGSIGVTIGGPLVHGPELTKDAIEYATGSPDGGDVWRDPSFQMTDTTIANVEGKFLGFGVELSVTKVVNNGTAITFGLGAVINGELILSSPSWDPRTWTITPNVYVTVETGVTVGALGAGVGGMIGATYDEGIASVHGSLDFGVAGIVAEYGVAAEGGLNESWSERRDRALGTPGTPGYLGDEYLTNEVVSSYVNAYASGEMKAAANTLVSGYNGVVITKDPNFYPDRIIRQQAGYEGGVPTPANNGGNGNSGNGNAGSGMGAGRPGSEGGDSRREGNAGSGSSHGGGTPQERGTNSASSGGYGYQGSPDNSPSGGRPSSNSAGTSSRTDTSRRTPNAPEFVGPQPIRLDLEGDGVEITQFSHSTQFFDAGGDGLKHRTAGAGARDGVTFFDADNDGKLSHKREYVFTE